MLGNLTLVRRAWSRRNVIGTAGGLVFVGVVAFWAWLVFGSSGLTVTPPAGPIPAGMVLLSVQTTPGAHYYSEAPTPAGGGIWGVDLANGSNRKRMDGLVEHARVSPDGRSIVFRDDLGATWLGPIGGGERRRVAVDQGRPVWSADGKSLFVSDLRMVPTGNPRDSMRWEYLGHSRINVADLKSESLPLPRDDQIQDVSRDGHWLLMIASSSSKIYVTTLDGRESRTLSAFHDANAPRFSPDGRRVAFLRTRWKGKVLSSNLCIVNLDGTGLTVGADDLSEAQSLCWSPDGSAILVKQHAGLMLVREGRSAEPIPLAVRKPFDLFNPRANLDPNPLYVGIAEWLPPKK